MPALLAPPPAPDFSPGTPRDDDRGAGPCAPSSPFSSPWPRRLAGLACLALALLLAGSAALPLAPVAIRAGGAVRLALLGSVSDLLRGATAPDGTASTGAAHGDESGGACTSGDRDVVGASVVVERDAWVCGHVTTYGGNVSVLGRVDGEVRAIGGSVQVSGQVGGGVTAVGGNVDLEPGARVQGDVQALGGTVNTNPGVSVQGRIQPNDSLQSLRPGSDWGPLAPTGFSWFTVLFWVLAAAALGLLLPRALANVRAKAQEQPIQGLVTGAGAVVLGALAAVVLIFTLLGIPLAALLAALLWVGWVVGTVALGLWLGESILRAPARGRRPRTLLAAVLGTALLGALEALPYAGWPIGIVVGLLGLGATIRAFFAARRKRALR